MATIHIKIEDRALADYLIKHVPNLQWLCTYIDFMVEPPVYRNTQFATEDLEAVYSALYIIEEWNDISQTA